MSPTTATIAREQSVMEEWLHLSVIGFSSFRVLKDSDTSNLARDK